MPYIPVKDRIHVIGNKVYLDQGVALELYNKLNDHEAWTYSDPGRFYQKQAVVLFFDRLKKGDPQWKTPEIVLTELSFDELSEQVTGVALSPRELKLSHSPRRLTFAHSDPHPRFQLIFHDSDDAATFSLNLKNMLERPYVYILKSPSVNSELEGERAVSTRALCSM